MKKIKILTTGLFLLLFIQVGFSQKTSDYKDVAFKLNVECCSSKAKVENALKGTKGVISANLDTKSKIVKVKFNDKVISQKEVEKVLKEQGYKTELAPNCFSKKKDDCKKSDKKEDCKKSCDKKKDCKKSGKKDCKKSCDKKKDCKKSSKSKKDCKKSFDKKKDCKKASDKKSDCKK